MQSGEKGLVTRITLERLNAAKEDELLAALGDVYEHAPWVARAIVAQRPFPTLAALNDSMQQAVRRAPQERRLALIRGHPDLAGKAALAGAVTRDSVAEQASAGLDRLSQDELDRFHRLNESYRARFGMPFIICVRRHGKESILRQFERRLQHSLEQETEAALGEIFRIAALRLDQRIEAPDRLPVNGRLSTHVLDTQGGRPAAGLAIELTELGGGEAPVLARAVTNRDGRPDEPLLAGRPLPIARYELRFHVGDYFARGPAAPADPPFLDLVPVRFAVAEPEGHYHVPLLVTPWSYTTYRGS
jgi:2-oxo-4-hydroxy-4-carboxy-5-ureidoimidazoline decarboxylase